MDTRRLGCSADSDTDLGDAVDVRMSHIHIDIQRIPPTAHTICDETWKTHHINI